MNATTATQATTEPRPWLAHYPAAVPPEIGDPGTLRFTIDGVTFKPFFETYGRHSVYLHVTFK